MSRARSICLLAVVCVSACGVFAEQPSWQDTAGQVFLIRQHWWNPVGERYDGVWRFDPDTGASQRLRPFHFHTRPDSDLEHHQDGFASVLAGNGELLVFQAWPYFVEFEAASWRILRRYPPLADPGAAGWAVRGAVVSDESADLLDLESGVYGFALCLRTILSIWGSLPSGNICDPYLFPGYSEPLSFLGDASVLLRRDLAPDEGAISSVAAVEPIDYESEFKWIVPSPPVLSVDTHLEGFWRGTRRGVGFLPIEDGQIGQPSISAEFQFPPFDNPGVVLSALLFHPLRRMFFGVGLGPGYDTSMFFSVDEAFEPIDVYEVSSRPEVGRLAGMPVTLAALGPLPSRHEQMLPVVARTPGMNETTWTSTAWLYNPSSESATVEVRRVVAPEERRVVELAPRSSIKIPDILTWAGGGPDGDGVPLDALVLTSPYRWGEQVVAVSRTFTPFEPQSGAGSYGQAVPSVPSRLGYSNHLQLVDNWPWVYNGISEKGKRAAHLDLDHRFPERFRHNIGVVNDRPEPLRVTLVWGWDDSVERMRWRERPEATIVELPVAGQDVHIANLEALFPSWVRSEWPPRVAVFADRPASIWLSMVDNLTGDATFVPFTAFHWRTDADDNRGAIPAVAHTTGTNATTWVTDVYGIQGNAFHPLDVNGYDTPRAVFHPARPETQCDGAALDAEIMADLEGVAGSPGDEWEPGDRTIFPDVLRLFGPCAEETELSGALELVTASWTSGYSRTYTAREDDGTYGGMLPFYPIGGWPVQHFAGIEVSDEFRVNVGLFNGNHEHPITHRVTLYAADGTQVAERILTLQPLASFQRRLEHLFQMEPGDLAQGTYGLTVLPLDDEEAGVQGRSWAYVSLVDNVTGDPTNWW